MPRSARLDAPGALHQIMIRGIERRKIFKDDDDREDFLGRLEKLLPITKTSCFAWALIPNHAHFLFRTGNESIATLKWCGFLRQVYKQWVEQKKERSHATTPNTPQCRF